MEGTWKWDEDENRICPYNPYVSCQDKDKCQFCGWNPAEDARRRASLKRYGRVVIIKAPDTDNESEHTPGLLLEDL